MSERRGKKEDSGKRNSIYFTMEKRVWQIILLVVSSYSGEFCLSIITECVRVSLCMYVRCDAAVFSPFDPLTIRLFLAHERGENCLYLVLTFEFVRVRRLLATSC
jgi:hypothetical protein